MPNRALAFDLGGSSGRAVIGTIADGILQTQELHRFDNTPVTFLHRPYWDVLRLFHEIQTGLAAADAQGSCDTIGIDTWGVDYGLLDDSGLLLQNPAQYRDTRMQGLVAKWSDTLQDSYRISGIQPLEINTLYQLLADWETRPALMQVAQTLLMMPDLLGYFLTGKRYAERSIASTTQLLDCHTGNWSDAILAAAKLPIRDMLPDVIPSGTVVAPVLADAMPIPLSHMPDVVAVCGHDTQCAMAAVPTAQSDFIFLSCGTWALFGTELPKPIVTPQAEKYGLSNELGYGGRVSFLKNLTGLWLIQETRRWLNAHGNSYSYADLELLALQSPAFRSFIDVKDAAFVPAGNMPERICAACRATGQPIPESVGAQMRCIYESLALSFSRVLDEITQCTGKTYIQIHMLGGGVKDRLLCQMTADACGIPVVAGPIEATVYGNLVIQFLATRTLSTLEEAHNLIAHSVSPKVYQPQSDWTAAKQAYSKQFPTQ